MTKERIGAAAGAVWDFLRTKAESGATITELKKKAGTKFTGDEIVAGLGWLARENKLDTESNGRKTVIRLARHELATAPTIGELVGALN